MDTTTEPTNESKASTKENGGYNRRKGLVGYMIDYGIVKYTNLFVGTIISTVP